MEHDIVVLKARIRLLESDNILLQQKLRDKRREINFLEKTIRKLELKIPHKITEKQLSLDEFI